MSWLFYRLGVAIASLLLISAEAYADDVSHIWAADITPVWLDDHIAVARRARPVRHSYRLSRTQIWASGISKTEMYAFAPTDLDRVVGAKLQLFHDLNFNIGTHLSRRGGEGRPLSGAGSWEAFWSPNQEQSEGLIFGLSTAGFVDYRSASYSQSLNGMVGISLSQPTDRWRIELRVSPSMHLDASSGSVGTALLSEIMSQTVIGGRNDAFLSVLNVKVGYSMAPNARPVASARLELRISPNL